MDERLARWLDVLLSTPGLTSIRDRADAQRVHIEESLGAVGAVRAFPGAIVDVYRLNNCSEKTGRVPAKPFGDTGLQKGVGTSYLPAP